ncbi:hypothetical protein Hamer_G013173 [Homarus americanus]|uniref:Uncharacterized protein n=1 Tax=Homarus americanus TaxID=6706 RepID=A0A8J5K175_HOMAM|nr:hypothetical protein Hamer_G013173 [Homarus americanus]
MPTLPVSKKPKVTKKRCSDNADDMDMCFLEELKKMREQTCNKKNLELLLLRRFRMNIKVVLLVLVTFVWVALGAPNVIKTPRDFPGQRRLGRTNYGTHSFGSTGYSRYPIARSSRRRNFG